MKWPWSKKESKAVEVEKVQTDIETKSEGVPFSGLVVNNPMLDGASSWVNYLQNNNEWKLSFNKMIEYYDRCDPLADAIDMIANSCAEIEPIVKDKITGELIDDHPVLDFLDNPSDNKDYNDFVIEAVSMYLITGSPFLRIAGDFTSEPSSLSVLRPNESRIEPDLVGNIREIYIDNEFWHTVFKAETVIDTTRYRNTMDNEIWPMFGFNSAMGTRDFYGTPKMQQLFYKIEQMLAGGLHNKSLLENGTRPMGSYSTDPKSRPLSDEQFKRMQQQIVDNYMGAQNAGKPILMEWVKYQEHLVNNRDMDYSKLMEDNRVGIYNRLNIPLPMVEPQSQKFSNFSEAREAYTINAVLPTLFFLFRQLKLALMYRFETDWRRYDIVADISNIPALQNMKFENLKKQSDAAVNTVNELRAVIGYENLPNGDVVLRKSNEVPALDDIEEDDNGDDNNGDDE